MRLVIVWFGEAAVPLPHPDLLLVIRRGRPRVHPALVCAMGVSKDGQVHASSGPSLAPEGLHSSGMFIPLEICENIPILT